VAFLFMLCEVLISESMVKFSNPNSRFGGASTPVEMVLRPSSLLLSSDDLEVC